MYIIININKYMLEETSFFERFFVLFISILQQAYGVCIFETDPILLKNSFQTTFSHKSVSKNHI